LQILAQHLEQQGAWELVRRPSMEAAVRSWLAADLIVAVWTDELAMKCLVTELRQLPAGRRLPLILLGRPAPQGETAPTQPVRGVLCLPAPVSWRVLQLCLDEHRGAWWRRQRASLHGMVTAPGR